MIAKIRYSSRLIDNNIVVMSVGSKQKAVDDSAVKFQYQDDIADEIIVTMPMSQLIVKQIFLSQRIHCG